MIGVSLHSFYKEALKGAAILYNAPVGGHEGFWEYSLTPDFRRSLLLLGRRLFFYQFKTIVQKFCRFRKPAVHIPGVHDDDDKLMIIPDGGGARQPPAARV